ncbi:hypothetical protein [Bifidobacterium sp. UTBIF-68]|uniref:hypothetical protein n=1 Tax=Bifidobacterium sp. UTBIF-68 TaxID=1465262 RepID=UPI0015E3DCBD|nr:hypothetical protein [Bifidobacterium sp. UTBIF-68]
MIAPAFLNESKGKYVAGSSIGRLCFVHAIGFHRSWTVIMMVRPLSSMVAVLPVCDSVVSASFLREDWLHILGVDTA